MSSPTLAELPPWAGELVRQARVAHLGLVDDRDRPRVLPVTFALGDDSVYSVIDDKPKRDPGAEPARVRYLRRRPAAALTVDRYDDDWSKLAWVQVLGEVVIGKVRADAEAVSALREKYPAYRDRLPPGPLLRIVPERVLFWRASE